MVRSPLRISFFGGSTDYESFYREHGSFIIGATIDKYVWLSAKYKQNVLPKEHSIGYSKIEVVKKISSIKNRLIRETLRYCGIKNYIDFNSSADMPSRTGLGGSSSFCAGMVHLLKELNGEKVSKKDIAKSAIHIERNILKDSGGIQDQIWAAYGGFNTISIDKSGDFTVKPVPISNDFKKTFEESLVLIYTNDQRDNDKIAKSHDSKDKEKILDLSHRAYECFLKEDTQKIGEMLFESWLEKRKLSPLISTPKIDRMVAEVMNIGAYGVKLLGSGGCGFLLAICNPVVKKNITNKFREAVLDFRFEDSGTTVVYSGK